LLSRRLSLLFVSLLLNFDFGTANLMTSILLSCSL
jgi:hypothetical protein